MDIQNYNKLSNSQLEKILESKIIPEDFIKYSTNCFNKIKTRDLNSKPKNCENKCSIKENLKNVNNYNQDIMMKSEEESLSDLSDDSFKNLTNMKRKESKNINKENSSQEDKANEDCNLFEDNAEEDNDDLIDFGKARVNGKLLKMYEIKNKRSLLEKIILENKNENDLDQNDQSSNKDYETYGNSINSSVKKSKINLNTTEDILSSNNTNILNTSKNTILLNDFNNINNCDIKQSLSSENYINFNNKTKLNIFNNNNINGDNNENLNINLNIPKYDSANLFGTDKKNSEHTLPKQHQNNLKCNSFNPNNGFNLSLNLNYSEKKMNKKKSENNVNFKDNVNNKSYQVMNNESFDEDDEYELENFNEKGELEKNFTKNVYGHNQGLNLNNLNFDSNYNMSGNNQNEILSMLFKKLREEK